MDHFTQTLDVDLFDGIDTFLNGALGVESMATLTAARIIAARPPGEFDGVSFVAALFKRFADNWDRCLERRPKGSLQNFRWHKPQRNISPQNRSPEVTLERALIHALAGAGRMDWSNQVPIVSGVSGSHAGKRRAVDLVHKMPGDGFELVELKTASNTPLFAALEVLQYGLLWLLSRRDRQLLSYVDREMLDISVLHLSVLAPKAFYSAAPLGPLAQALDDGIAALGGEAGVAMRLTQTAFPAGFHWPGVYSDVELLSFLDNRELI
ncbi:MAG: hypothetical protein BGN87_13280 [Rhizobiales bacterium 65-79]|nr:hypothetical protein [Hyphomicrobiales bacterium]OJU06230.1 MAG: hypothetical protein BGN87_13280 [Rhizobiales bacterium 65-79]